jgi:hypothetical protein
VIRAFGPLEGNEFTYYTHATRAELEEAFATAIDKLVWK